MTGVFCHRRRLLLLSLESFKTPADSRYLERYWVGEAEVPVGWVSEGGRLYSCCYACCRHYWGSVCILKKRGGAGHRVSHLNT